MIRINSTKFRSDLKELREAGMKLRQELVGEETMTAVAEQGVTVLHERTQRGVDADLAPLKSYTKRYARYRAERGRGTRPDLTFTGRMLGAMASKFVKAGKALIVFTRTEEANKAAGNARLRDFFDIRAPFEVAVLAGELDRKVKQIVKRLGMGGTA